MTTTWISKKHRKMRPVLERFEEKIQEPDANGCLIWNAAKDTSNYGVFFYEGKLERAHRVAYKLYYGEFPKYFACHTCDVRECVNPLHLFDGTHQENMEDMVNKNRHISATDKTWSNGSRNPNVKLTEKDVINIRKIYDNKQMTQVQLASLYNIGQNQISRIIRREHWPHI